MRSHNTLEAICLGHPQDFLASAQTQAACKRAPIGTVYLSVAIKTSGDLAEIMHACADIYENLQDLRRTSQILSETPMGDRVVNLPKFAYFSRNPQIT